MRQSLSFLVCTALLFSGAHVQAAKQPAKIDFVTLTKNKKPDSQPPLDSAKPIQTSPDLKQTIRQHLQQDEAAPADGAPATLNDTLRQTWDSDIIVIPDPVVEESKTPLKVKPQPLPPVKVNIQLRKQPPEKPVKNNKKPAKTKKTDSVKKPAAVVKMPPAKVEKPALTRRQVLDNEIRRERNALRAAQNQLEQAKKKGNAKQVGKLQGVIKDRELNIKAIEKEIIR